MSAAEGGADGDASVRRIVVGVVGGPHGVRGELRVKSYTTDPMALAGYGPLHAGEGGRGLRVETARPLKDDMLVVRFVGVATREAAAALTGTRLSIDRQALPPPEPEEFYDADLIGLAVEDEAGGALGTVRAVVNFGAGDILDIDRGQDSLLVAFTRAFVPVVDLGARRIVVAAAALAEDEDEDGADGRSAPAGSDAP